MNAINRKYNPNEVKPVWLFLKELPEKKRKEFVKESLIKLNSMPYTHIFTEVFLNAKLSREYLFGRLINYNKKLSRDKYYYLERSGITEDVLNKLLEIEVFKNGLKPSDIDYYSDKASKLINKK